MFLLSLPMRGAWIEISLTKYSRAIVMSLPMRGAWIEIVVTVGVGVSCVVAPHAGSVD